MGDQLLMLETNATKMHYFACSQVAVLGTQTVLSSIPCWDDGTDIASSGFRLSASLPFSSYCFPFKVPVSAFYCWGREFGLLSSE